jgi:hypothetical protein
MCRIAMQAVKDGNEQVIMDVKRIAGAYEKEGWISQRLRSYVPTYSTRCTWAWQRSLQKRREAELKSY